MKVSHNLLQTYFVEKLPPAEKLAELFTFRAFEVEEIEKKPDDTILDLKVLPDRGHYALSHRGVAREISFITGMAINALELALPTIPTPASKILELEIRDKRCRRDTKLVIENISNKQSPEWLRKALENLGQRSISLIVDATNYVMLDMGQPMHAFDFDKLAKKNGVAKIVLKRAEKDQKITILGGKEIALDDDMLVFADANNNDLSLDIAGIKGGSSAEIDDSTKNIVLLASNYEPSYIRKASTRAGIRTDASKRSENGIPPELTLEGVLTVADMLLEVSPESKVEGIVDYYPAKPERPVVEVSAQNISNRLGIELPEKEIEMLFDRLEFVFKKSDGMYAITPPYYRQDIRIPEDIVEEVGRLYGYENIPSKLPAKPAKSTPINVVTYWSEKAKDVLAEHGYSEVLTYSLQNAGDIEIQNPLASDKGFMRANLREIMERALALNAKNAPLLGLEEIKLFEIGNVFTKEKGEYLALSIGHFTNKNIKHKAKVSAEIVEATVKVLQEKIGVEFQGLIEGTDSGVIFECDFSRLVEMLPHPEKWDIEKPNLAGAYKQISMYPFIARDIAVFVSEGVVEFEPLSIITLEAGELLVKHSLFDVFHKQMPDGTKKTSYAFRLVFQSQERTLTDDEINIIMNRITSAMNAKQDWQVR